VYGVAIESDSEGYTLPSYTILDEQKHLIFLLKHSKHEN
jgi:biotin operon repressor